MAIVDEFSTQFEYAETSQAKWVGYRLIQGETNS
jgi:hypothetical protein